MMTRSYSAWMPWNPVLVVVGRLAAPPDEFPVDLPFGLEQHAGTTPPAGWHRGIRKLLEDRGLKVVDGP